MRKRTNKKTPVKSEDVFANEDDEDDELSNSKGKGEATKGRQDNSLSVLTKKFIDLIKNSENATIDLNEAV